MLDDLISRRAVLYLISTQPSEEASKGLLYQSVKQLPSVQQWIPVTTRPMDEEERKRFSEKLGFDVEYGDSVIFECEMPDDGQEILVSYNGYVCMDKCEVDEDCLYGLEGNGDWYGVIAWCPLPEPYKAESEDKE